MGSLDKTLRTVLSGASDANVRFEDLRRILLATGFDERIRGDHFVYSKSGVAEILNLHPLPGGAAKPYQVKQTRRIITSYGLQLKR